MAHAQRWRALIVRIGKGSPYAVIGKKVVRHGKWQDSPAHAFFLVLALAKWYPKWSRSFGKDFNKQGQLFEEVSVSALLKIMPSWHVHKTGWSTKSANKIQKVVPAVAKALCEPVGEIIPWVSPQANEAGLDVLCYRPLYDNRPGMPSLMIQCASGLDYHEKALTPDLKTWSKLVGFTAMPKRALATPFAFGEDEFRQICNRVDGPLFDRCRLLHAGYAGGAWLDVALAKSIVTWVKPRVAKLPSAN